MNLRIILALFMLVLVGCSNDTMTVGVLYPLSGPVASWGEPARNGAILAMEEINRQGGIDGRSLRLVVEDSRCEPATGIAAAKKLFDVDGVKYLVGDICSAVVVPVAASAEQEGVVVMAQGSSPDISQLGDNIFRNWPSDEYQGRTVASYAYNEMGLRKVAVLNLNNPYGNGLASSFREHFTALGGAVVLEERFEQAHDDFRTPLLKAQELGAEALYSAAQEKDPLIARQQRELGLDLQLLGADAMATPAMVKAAQGALEGAVYAYPYFNESDRRVEAFRKAYSERFGGEPGLLLVAAHGYDAMMLLAEGLEGGDYEDTARVKERLYATSDYPGLSGITAFDENGDVHKPYGIYRIVNGTGVLLAVR